MRERPILFSAPMIRAILDGSKTQTRRTCKIPCEEPVEAWRTDDQGHWYGVSRLATTGGLGVPVTDIVRCPYGQPGDRLWVRETWALLEDAGAARTWDGQIPSVRPTPRNPQLGHIPVPVYAADGLLPFVTNQMGRPMTWKPSIHMPRWASRITLEVTDIRVERLTDISEEDARAEGVEQDNPDDPREERDDSICRECGGTGLTRGLGPNLGVIFDVDCTKCDTSKKRFRNLWEHINGHESWAASPWVWVVSFKRVTP